MRWTTRNMYRGDVRRWLGASGSLSARLAGAGQKFSVQVLEQGRQRLGPEEARALGLPAGQSGYVREVVLRVDDVAVVFARSATAHAQSLGPWRSIRGLGTQPLVTGEAVAARTLPARRSVFTRRGAPLLVMEVFAAAREPWCWPAGRNPDWTSPVFKDDE